MRNKKLFLWVLLLFVSGACHKVNNFTPTANLPTLRQYIAQDSSLSLLQLALQRAGLDSLLASGGPYTLFAPVDSAFLAAGFTADRIGTYDPGALRNLIGYSLISGRIGSATLQGFVTDSAVSAASVYEPQITQNYHGLFIDGIIVTQGNIALADGILHKTGQMALPPSGSLLQLLDSLPNTKMADYIFRQSAGLRAMVASPVIFFANYPTLQEGQIVPGYNLQGDGLPYATVTLLVPSDSAFSLYGFNSTADLAALDSATRTNLVVNCVLFGSYFTSDFMGGQIVARIANNSGFNAAPGIQVIDDLDEEGMNWYDTTYGFNTYVLSNDQNFGNTNYEMGVDGLTLYGNGILNPPQIVQPNIVTTGGVVHIINQVFAPSGLYSPGNPYRNQ